MVLFLQEMEDREKLVNHMWDVYTNSPRIRILKFWQEAFEAAYEELNSDVAEVREAAISEISKMSIQFVNIDLPPLRSMVSSLSVFQSSYMGGLCSEKVDSLYYDF